MGSGGRREVEVESLWGFGGVRAYGGSMSGAERSRAQLCTSGSVEALQHREWRTGVQGRCPGGAGTHGLVGKMVFSQRLDSMSLEIFSSLIDSVLSVPGCG